MVSEMSITEKYDKMFYGIMSGIVLPLLVGLVIYFFSAHGRSIWQYLSMINWANIVTHAISICVFPNVFIFLIFNRFDMLRAARGVLAITIIWAIAVFIIKFI
jgi:hypothetical protein